MMEVNKIINGNCIKVMSKMESDFFDMIYADPPVNITDYYWEGENDDFSLGSLKSMYDSLHLTGVTDEYIQFTDMWVSNAVRVLKKGGSFYTACTYENIAETIITLKKYKLNFVNLITWNKSANTTVSNGKAKRCFENTCEYLLLFTKGDHWVFNHEMVRKQQHHSRKSKQSKLLQNLWQIPPQTHNDDKGHDIHKPEELIKTAILASTNYGSVILDPFCRTGDLCVVSIKTDRNYVGISPNKDYIKTARRRISSVKRQINKKLKKGQVDLFVQPLYK